MLHLCQSPFYPPRKPPDKQVTISFHGFFFFLFIFQELTTWPANNCLQIRVLLQIIFCSCALETTLLCEHGGSVPRAGGEWFDIFRWSKERWSNDKTIIELGPYGKISWLVSVSQINYLIITDLLATDKSRYFAQPRPIIVNYSYFRLSDSRDSLHSSHLIKISHIELGAFAIKSSFWLEKHFLHFKANYMAMK